MSDVDMRALFCGGLIAAGLLHGVIAHADPLNTGATAIKLPKGIIAPADVSGIAKLGEHLVIGADEAVSKKESRASSGSLEKKGNYVQILSEDDSGEYKLASSILLFKGDKKNGKEMDIEGIAVDGNSLYVIGSHSSRRQKTDPENSRKENAELFRDDEIVDEKNRDWVYRIVVDDKGAQTKKEKVTLRDIIASDPVLRTFAKIPSKENGVDIEGLAMKDGLLYAGFRGPVFRENYVPVMRFSFDKPDCKNRLLYLRLGGRGIRDMAAVSDGFLVLAGPVGDGPGSYQLYHWDGNDLLPGTNRTLGRLRLLGDIEPPISEVDGKKKRGKAEGVAVMREDAGTYDLIVAYDGVHESDKVLQRFQVSKR